MQNKTLKPKEEVKKEEEEKKHEDAKQNWGGSRRSHSSNLWRKWESQERSPLGEGAIDSNEDDDVLVALNHEHGCDDDILNSESVLAC